MKKKKVISAIVLFGLALSSCEQCPKPKPEPNPLKRTTPVLRRLDLNLTKLDGLIEKLRDGGSKAAFKSTSKALKHAANIISNPAAAHANRDAFDVAKGFTREAENFTNDARAGRPHAVEDFIRDVGDDNRNRAEATAEAAAGDILHAAYYAEYVITEVAHIPPTARSPYADAHAADVVRNFAPACARYVVTDNAEIAADPAAINAAINAANELAKKVGELERFFKDWQSRQLGH